MFANIDINFVIFVVYILFLISIPLASKHFTRNTSDFIVAGKKQYFWIAFAGVFMSNFSSWAFTGAAAKAYESGFAVLAVFLGNSCGYVFAAVFLSYKMRQTNLETSHQIIQARFGKKSQQILLWVGIPINLVGHSIRIYGISLFLSAIYNIPLIYPVLGTALMIMFIIIAGGAWTVSTTNLMQFFFLVPTTVILGIIAIYRSHGISHMIHAIPQEKLFGNLAAHHSFIFIAWIIIIMINQVYSAQSMNISGRYLSVIDSRTAIRVAWTCAGLFILIPFFWYSPVWSMWSLTTKTNLAAQYPILKHAVNNAAYIYSVGLLKIKGMFGIIGAIMFATTVAALAGAINNNTGNILRTFYQPKFAPEASDKHLLTVSRLIVCVWCSIIVILSLWLSSITVVSLFDAVIFLGSLLRFPIVVPLALGLIIKRTPDWSAWVTPVFGLFISLLSVLIVKYHFLGILFPFFNFSQIHSNDLLIIVSVVMHCVFTSGFFISTKMFYTPPKLNRYRVYSNLFQKIIIPVVNLKVDETDAQRRVLMSKLLYVLCGFMLSLAFFTKEGIYFYIALCIGVPACWLMYSGQKIIRGYKK